MGWRFTRWTTKRLQFSSDTVHSERKVRFSKEEEKNKDGASIRDWPIRDPAKALSMEKVLLPLEDLKSYISKVQKLVLNIMVNTSQGCTKNTGKMRPKFVFLRSVIGPFPRHVTICQPIMFWHLCMSCKSSGTLRLRLPCRSSRKTYFFCCQELFCWKVLF